MSRIQQDFINCFTIPCPLHADPCSQQKYCTRCMKQWQIDIFFQISEAAQLNHKVSVLCLVSVNLPLLPKLPTCFPRLSHHIYLTCTNPAQCRSCYPSASQQSSCQQSAVNCWTQHVNKHVQLSSSASGRCHTDRALCGGRLLVCGLVWIHCVNRTATVWYTACTKCKNSQVHSSK